MLGGGFQLNLAAGWMDAYYTSLNPCLLSTTPTCDYCVPANGLQTTQGGGGFTLDSDLPKTPEYKFSVSPIWDIHLANDNTLRLQADYTSPRTCTTTDRIPRCCIVRPRTCSMPASIACPRAGTTKFIVGGTNLTDDRYLTVGSVNYTAGEVVGSYNAPSAWYATLRLKM